MKAHLLFLGSLMITMSFYSQVGIGTTTPSPAAMLEVSSRFKPTDGYKGILPPRVPNIAARDEINASYVDYGLMVFVADNGSGKGCLQIWDGESWSDIKCITLASAVAWINEFHYDNVGNDVGEFIEIAGPAGLDLSTYTIELYNGENGKQYGSTISLSGTIPNESNGIGTLSFTPPISLQNGDPDGFALIHSGTVIQFLSYGGTITALDGTAHGRTSIDIGVKENSTTPVGYSLQLKGTGNGYNHFYWDSPSAESPGAINAGQIIN